MPQKLQCYVPKSYSRKGKENAPRLANLTSSELKNALCSRGFNKVSVSVQTDLQLSTHPTCLVDAAVQTEDSTISSTRNEASVQTESLEVGNETKEMECDSEPDDSYSLCEGNNDEKLIPLVIIHKGVFKNVPVI